MGVTEIAVIELLPQVQAPPGFKLTEFGNRRWAYRHNSPADADPGEPVYIITDNSGMASAGQGYGVDDDIWYACDAHWLLVAAPNLTEGAGFVNYLRRNGTAHTWQKEFASFRQSTASELTERFELWEAIVAIADRIKSECGDDAKGTAA